MLYWSAVLQRILNPWADSCPFGMQYSFAILHMYQPQSTFWTCTGDCVVPLKCWGFRSIVGHFTRLLGFAIRRRDFWCNAGMFGAMRGFFMQCRDFRRIVGISVRYWWDFSKLLKMVTRIPPLGVRYEAPSFPQRATAVRESTLVLIVEGPCAPLPWLYAVSP